MKEKSAVTTLSHRVLAQDQTRVFVMGYNGNTKSAISASTFGSAAPSSPLSVLEAMASTQGLKVALCVVLLPLPSLAQRMEEQR